MATSIEELIAPPKLIVHQIKEWMEIIVDWETRNKYQITTETGEKSAFLAERSGGFLKTIARLILRSHRNLVIDVIGSDSQPLLHLQRPFFFFFSDMFVKSARGQLLGRVHRRFGIIYKKYDLVDNYGKIFAHVKSPLWRLWKFPVITFSGNEVAVITKKWQGLLKEAFTDADRYLVDYGAHQWSENQKVILLATAISIDFDFFENNQGRSGGIFGD